MTPDITVTVPPKHGKEIAIELENDIDWDFQKSLRKAKKYKVKFDDARVIIPKKYEKFAPLYQHEGFRVYLWEATRVWQCIKCRSMNESKETLSPRCPKCKKYGKHRFIEAKDAKFEEHK